MSRQTSSIANDGIAYGRISSDPVDTSVPRIRVEFRAIATHMPSTNVTTTDAEREREVPDEDAEERAGDRRVGEGPG